MKLLLVATLASCAGVIPAALAASTGNPDSADVGLQDKAFKMSPQDKSYVDKTGDKDKFSAPQKAPGGSAGDGKVSDTKQKVTNDENNPVILNDYDPNNLGVPASGNSAATDYEETKKTKPGTEKAKAETPDTQHKDKSDPKAGLGTGTGEGTGGVGASPDDAAAKAADSTPAKPANPAKPAPVAANPAESVVAGSSTGAGSVPADSASTSSDKAASDTSSDKVASDTELDEVTYGTLGRVFATASMIVLSELGDKTFFIAALMAMKHSAWFVFSASFGALAVMTILSAVLGMVLPSLLSKSLTTLLAALLFLGFGAKLLKEGLEIDSQVHATEEMHEVEQELGLKESSMSLEAAEKGGVMPPVSQGTGAGLVNLLQLVFSPLWIQIFLMTFLAEWGDRSQIATVALSAGGHYVQVIVGGLAGHALCTGIAIYGGRLLAARLSLRTMTLSGAGCFFFFAVLYLYDWYTGA